MSSLNTPLSATPAKSSATSAQSRTHVPRARYWCLGPYALVCALRMAISARTERSDPSTCKQEAGPRANVLAHPYVRYAVVMRWTSLPVVSDVLRLAAACAATKSQLRHVRPLQCWPSLTYSRPIVPSTRTFVAICISLIHIACLAPDGN